MASVSCLDPYQIPGGTEFGQDFSIGTDRHILRGGYRLVTNVLSDDEEATDNDSTDNDEDYESYEEKKPLPTKRKAKLQGQRRQGAITNSRPRKPPPASAAVVATAAGNKHGSAPSTPIIYIGGYKAASREYKNYLHFLAINRKGSPWSDSHYGCLRKRFSGHDMVLITNGQETKAKKQDVIKSAAQIYKTILKKLSRAQEQVTNKRADRNDNIPTAATQEHTAPVITPAAGVTRVADATPMNDGADVSLKLVERHQTGCRIGPALKMAWRLETRLS